MDQGDGANLLLRPPGKADLRGKGPASRPLKVETGGFEATGRAYQRFQAIRRRELSCQSYNFAKQNFTAGQDVTVEVIALPFNKVTGVQLDSATTQRARFAVNVDTPESGKPYARIKPYSESYDVEWHELPRKTLAQGVSSTYYTVQSSEFELKPGKTYHLHASFDEHLDPTTSAQQREIIQFTVPRPDG